MKKEKNSTHITHKTFNKREAKGTHRKINDSISRYERMIVKQEISTEDDCVKIEMADDFLRELRGIRESFLNGK
jgi:hypothetical protein